MGLFGGRDRAEAFAAQFEPRGKGYIYRKSMRGEPYAVTVDERDGFIAAHARQTRRAIRGLGAALALLVGAAVFWGADLVAAEESWVIWGGGVLFILASFLMFQGIWTAPARSLEDRFAEGAALTGAEARKTYLRRTRYAQLAGVAFAALFLFARFAQEHDVAHGWARLAPAGLVAVLAVLLVRAVQKWRVGRSDE